MCGALSPLPTEEVVAIEHHPDVFGEADDLIEILRTRFADLHNAALEGVALEGYRHGILSLVQVRELLDLSSRWAAQDARGAQSTQTMTLIGNVRSVPTSDMPQVVVASHRLQESW